MSMWKAIKRIKELSEELRGLVRELEDHYETLDEELFHSLVIETTGTGEEVESLREKTKRLIEVIRDLDEDQNALENIFNEPNKD